MESFPSIRTGVIQSRFESRDLRQSSQIAIRRCPTYLTLSASALLTLTRVTHEQPDSAILFSVELDRKNKLENGDEDVSQISQLLPPAVYLNPQSELRETKTHSSLIGCQGSCSCDRSHLKPSIGPKRSHASFWMSLLRTN